MPRGNCPDCLGPPPCRDCLSEAGIDRVVALGAYEGVLADAVRQFKFHGRRELAAFLGKELAVACQPLSARSPVLVPVPSHRRRVHERGFDHIGLVAGAISRSSGLASAPVLVRLRPTPPLYRLSRFERQRVLAGAFACRKSVPERVILVDDLLTTGATALAAALCLREAGARSVDLAVVARA